MIGACVSEWAVVDDELFRIFRDCIGPYEQCAILYYRMPGLDIRLNAVDEIVKSVLPKPERKSGGHPHVSVKIWNKIKKEFSELLSVRRRIAHHPVGVGWPGGITYPIRSINRDAVSKYAVPEPSFQLYMNEHEVLRAGEQPKSLEIEDLEKHLKSVVLLRDMLRRFYFEYLISAQRSAPIPQSPPRSPVT